MGFNKLHKSVFNEISNLVPDNVSTKKCGTRIIHHADDWERANLVLGPFGPCIYVQAQSFSIYILSFQQYCLPIFRVNGPE